MKSERVDTVWRIFFENISKKLKLKSRKSFQINLKKATFTRLHIELFFTFSKMRQSISTITVILSFMIIFVARTFWVELHLNVVLKDLQVVGSNFFFFKFVDIKHRKIFTMIALLRGRYLTF